MSNEYFAVTRSLDGQVRKFRFDCSSAGTGNAIQAMVWAAGYESTSEIAEWQLLRVLTNREYELVSEKGKHVRAIEKPDDESIHAGSYADEDTDDDGVPGEDDDLPEFVEDSDEQVYTTYQYELA